MSGEEQVFFAILDGDDPAGWIPWETSRESLARTLKLPDLRADAERVRRNFKIDLLDHGPDLLLARKEVGRIVGVVVDGIDPGGDTHHANVVLRRFETLCANIAQTETAWWRRVGFFVLVAAKEISPAHSNFRYEIMKAAESAFGPGARISIESVNDDEYFVIALARFGLAMIQHDRIANHALYAPGVR